MLLRCSLWVDNFNHVALVAKYRALIVFSMTLAFVLLKACVSAPRSYLANDSSLTDKETVMLVEEVVLLIAFAFTEIKRLLFIESMIDSLKV